MTILEESFKKETIKINFALSGSLLLEKTFE